MLADEKTNQSENSDVCVYKSACRMCHGGCGALITVVDDTIKRAT